MGNMKANCDKKGRIYLRERYRNRYGEKFIIVETIRGLLLLPVPSDPVADLASLGRKLRNYTMKDLKTAIQQQSGDEIGR